ncbi:pentatricopeptide repeat-containing protein At2g37310 [Aristolochia californica]|uniref:pentatricopeptide repeat-containing protein At2g37310 n=1 Tax=Aristolochia californica TaxID=171875 RepID=UPI0035DA2F96
MTQLQFQASLATNGTLRVALAALTKQDYPINCQACGHFIQYCSDHHLISPAKQIHTRLLLLNVIPDNFLGSKLLSFYARSGNIPAARRLFDDIPRKSTFSFNAMLFAYSHHDRHIDAIKLFYLMTAVTLTVKPDNFSLTSILKSLSSHKWPFLRTSLGKEIQAFSVRHGFDCDVFVSNALVTFYTRTSELSLARKVFDAIHVKDIVSWNAMICGYSQSGEWELCLRLYEEMTKETSLLPNGITVVGILQACSQLKDLMFGMEVHKFAIENGIEMDASVWNALIGFYAKCGSLGYARELFNEMNERDGVTYGAMISGYMNYGCVKEGMDLFREMGKTDLSTWNAVLSGLVQNGCYTDVVGLLMQMQTEGFRPNSVTLASVLPTFSYFSNLIGGKQIHCYAIRNDYDRNIYIRTALIDVYAKCGFLEGARLVFLGVTIRSVIVWTAIISAYAAHGDADAALYYFSKMLMGGIHPDPVTFTAVLAACAHVGAVVEAQRIFDSMSFYGVESTVEHYACFVGTLSRAGMLSEAVDMVSKMPVEPNAKVWGALLNGAAITCDVQVGKYAYDHLLEIEPKNTGNYIIFANILARAGKWEEAEKVRDKMKSMDLNKVPGCSWIETTYGMMSFMASDTFNWKSEEIYEILDSLLGLMREEGYVSNVECVDEIFFT